MGAMAVNHGCQVDPGRVAVYIRWSTDEQAEGTTLAVQLEACRHFILAQGWAFRDDLLFVDDGCSGSTLDRPALSRLRRAVAQGDVACVVVYKLDRLSRSVLDTVTLVLREWDGICAVRSTREAVDTASPTGSMLFYLLASYAEWERATIRERTMSGKIKRAQQGRNPGFPPPYGYARGDQPGQWVVAEAEAVIVRQIFRAYLAGRGVHTIAADLNQAGIRPRRAGAWRGETIWKIIANPAYTGLLRYGLTAAATPAQRRQGGRGRTRLADPRYACVEGAVPALVSQAEFEQARQIRASRGATAGCRARGGAFLLAGIARCRCGATLRGDARKGSLRYYRCTGGCASGLLPAAPLEDAVLAHVSQMLEGAWEAPPAPDREAERKQISSALAKAARTRARLSADYLSGDLPAKLYAAHTADLDRQEAALQSALAALGAKPPLAPTQAPALADALAHLAPEERKQLLRFAVSRCLAYRAPGRDGGIIELELVLRKAGA